MGGSTNGSLLFILIVLPIRAPSFIVHIASSDEYAQKVCALYTLWAQYPRSRQLFTSPNDRVHRITDFTV